MILPPLISSATCETKHTGIWLADHGCKLLQAWACFIRTPLKMTNQDFKKLIRIQRAELHFKKPTQSPLPFPATWVCGTFILQLLGVAGYFYLSIYLNQVLKPCTNLSTGLWERTSKGLVWRCFVLLLDAILPIAAAGCSSSNRQALQTMCVGWLMGCRARYSRLCPAGRPGGGGGKGKPYVTLSNAAGNRVPGWCLVPSVIQVMVGLKWQSASYRF